VKQAIVATVVGVEKKSSDSVLVLLDSDELREATEIVSTGLDCEQSRKSAGASLEEVCSTESPLHETFQTPSEFGGTSGIAHYNENSAYRFALASILRTLILG
jgi:hypothetical protein